MGFNIKKYKVVSFEYGMTDTQNNVHVLSSEDSESDIGILFKKYLKFD